MIITIFFYVLDFFLPILNLIYLYVESGHLIKLFEFYKEC